MILNIPIGNLAMANTEVPKLIIPRKDLNSSIYLVFEFPLNSGP